VESSDHSKRTQFKKGKRILFAILEDGDMAGLTIDVKSRTIQTLITEIQSGKYMLPSFQRQFVWDEDDIRALIDSIINNYPIGSIILWKPSSPSTAATDPFSKPLIDLGNKKSSEVF